MRGKSLWNACQCLRTTTSTLAGPGLHRPPSDGLSVGLLWG